MTTSPRLLIAAGPTHEPIDAVRFLGNRSSGRMGLALFEAALARNLPTTLLLGPVPVAPQPPRNSQAVIRRFQTTEDLRSLLTEQWPRHDVLIMAAAVSDFRPTATPDPAAKRPRGEAIWRLELEPTPDLLETLASTSRPDQLLVGFALEPADRLPDAARDKLTGKNLHAIVANPLETMGAETITATLLLRDGSTLAPPKRECTKREFARWLLDEVTKRYETR